MLCIYYYYVVLFYLQILPENTEVESIPAAGVVEEEIEELGVKSPSMLLQERQDHAEKSGQIISLLDDEIVHVVVVVDEEADKENDVVIPSIDVPSFEEIRSAMGFSPLNNTNDSIPHDEDLMGWHSPIAPPPNRRSIYDPLQII